MAVTICLEESDKQKLINCEFVQQTVEKVKVVRARKPPKMDKRAMSITEESTLSLESKTFYS